MRAAFQSRRGGAKWEIFVVFARPMKAFRGIINFFLWKFIEILIKIEKFFG